MLYHLEQDSVEKIIIQQCLRERLPLPEKIQKAPQLYLGLELYYTAFFDLHSCRPFGISEGPIGWIAIQEYCMHLGLCEDQEEAMHYHIRAMDNAYLERQNKQNEQRQKGRSKHGHP